MERSLHPVALCPCLRQPPSVLQEKVVTLVPELVIFGDGQVIVVVVALFVHHSVAVAVGSEVEFAVAPIDWHAALDCRLPPAFVPSFDDVVYFVKSAV